GLGRRYARADRRPSCSWRAVRVPRPGGARADAAERFPATRHPQERRDRRVAPRRNVDVLQADAAGGRALPSAARDARSRLRGAGCLEERRGAPAHGSRADSMPMSAAAEEPSLARRLVAEGLGTTLLLATVVGSGIMGERLAGGNVAIALLANALATGAGLVAFIRMLGPISGAHFNPAVTLADAALGGLPWREVAELLGAAAAPLVFLWLV